ncbi:hypothetical protein [Vulgatibacter sp.]|uniref:hypothetical protein n=1 Tax=Vulgatibacter sp. TaxID=1971226 RepID=UPI0035664730
MALAAYSAKNILAAATQWIGVTATVPWNLAASTSAVDPAFAAQNVAKGRAGMVCRAKNTAPFQLGVNLALPAAASVCALVNHNLRPTAEVWLAHASSQSGPWTWIEVPITEGACWVPLALASRRYWRLIVEGVQTVDGRPVQIGEWWLGELVDLPPFVWGAELGEATTDAFGESEYGVPNAHFLSTRRTFAGSFSKALPEASAVAVEAFKRQVQGRVKPFLFTPDKDDRSRVMLGRLADASWQRQLVLPGRVDGADFAFREDPWGKTGA